MNTAYDVRGAVAGKRHKEPFKTSALAESFRSGLLFAAKQGEAFDIETGLPVSMSRSTLDMSWYDFGRKFVDLKWPRVAATTRRTHAEAMTALTPLMFATKRGKPDGKLIRRALYRWAFNTSKRDDPSCPETALAWVKRYLPVTERVPLWRRWPVIHSGRQGGRFARFCRLAPSPYCADQGEVHAFEDQTERTSP